MLRQKQTGCPYRNSGTRNLCLVGMFHYTVIQNFQQWLFMQLHWHKEHADCRSVYVQQQSIGFLSGCHYSNSGIRTPSRIVMFLQKSDRISESGCPCSSSGTIGTYNIVLLVHGTFSEVTVMFQFKSDRNSRRVCPFQSSFGPRTLCRFSIGFLFYSILFSSLAFL